MLALVFAAALIIPLFVAFIALTYGAIYAVVALIIIIAVLGHILDKWNESL